MADDAAAAIALANGGGEAKISKNALKKQVFIDVINPLLSLGSNSFLPLDWRAMRGVIAPDEPT